MGPFKDTMVAPIHGQVFFFPWEPTHWTGLAIREHFLLPEEMSDDAGTCPMTARHDLRSHDMLYDHGHALRSQDMLTEPSCFVTVFESNARWQY